MIHHLSSSSRRIAGIKAVLDTLRRDGKALIYVWALEQKSSRRGWDELCEQDVMVPWKTKRGQEDVTYLRYYHLFRKGELEECVAKAGGKVLEGGYEKVRLRDKWLTDCYRTIGGLLLPVQSRTKTRSKRQHLRLFDNCEDEHKESPAGSRSKP